MTARATLWLAVVLAEGVALLAAVRCERRLHVAPRFPVTALLVIALVIDLAVAIEDAPFAWGLAALAAAPRPRHGAPLLAYHAADALVMAWPCALAWTCLRAFRPPPHPLSPEGRAIASLPYSRRNPAKDKHEPAIVPVGTRALQSTRFLLATVYLAALAVLVVGHPLGEARTRRVLLAVELVALVVAGAAIAAGWRRAVAGRATWTRSHGALLVLAPVELAVAVIGPFARPDVFRAWNVARGQYLIAFVLVAALLAWPRRSTARR